MSTKIDWCDEVWNPTTGCTKDCSYCYARPFAERMAKNPNPKIAHKYSNGFTPTIHPESLSIPLRWWKPRRIFVDSMGDLFDPEIPFEFVDKVLAVIAMSGKHTFLVLTKQPERMREYFSRKIDWREHLAMVGSKSFGYNAECMIAHSLADHENFLCRRVGWPMRNLWLGVSTTNQTEADALIPHLIQTPAARRFISIEPMLGPVDLYRGGFSFLHNLKSPQGKKYPALDWVICGLMSGSRKGIESCSYEDVAGLRDQCGMANVPFYFKGWGSFRPGAQLDGREYREFPA